MFSWTTDYAPGINMGRALLCALGIQRRSSTKKSQICWHCSLRLTHNPLSILKLQLLLCCSQVSSIMLLPCFLGLAFSSWNRTSKQRLIIMNRGSQLMRMRTILFKTQSFSKRWAGSSRGTFGHGHDIINKIRKGELPFSIKRGDKSFLKPFQDRMLCTIPSIIVQG